MNPKIAGLILRTLLSLPVTVGGIDLSKPNETAEHNFLTLAESVIKLKHALLKRTPLKIAAHHECIAHNIVGSQNRPGQGYF